MNLKWLVAGALTLVSGAAFAQSNPRVTPQAVIVNPVQTSLQVNVRLDKGGTNPLYVEGETQRISVTVNQDAYVYVFNIQANGTVAVLLPNGFSGGTPFLRANETRTFPGPNAGYELTIGAPYGQEKILALASKTQLDLGQVVPQIGSNQIVNATVQGQEGLARALAVTVTPLPPQNWVTDVADFRTQARNAPAANGVLVVNTDPNGANVYVDGVLVGRGDLRLNIPAGQRTIRVTANGFQDFQQTVNIGGGQTVTVNAQLRSNQPQPTVGTLVVNVNPNGANVYVDGVLVGRGDLRLNIPAGNRTVRVTASGFQDFQQSVTVFGGQTTTVNANLQPVQVNGTLNILAPNGSSVYIDGVLVGNGNVSRNIPAGTRTVRVTLDGFQDFQQTVTVRNGQTTTVQANLQPVQRDGTLFIRSNVPGARIFINGNEIGVVGQDGSLSIQGLPAGSHELVLIAPNYRAFVVTFTINGGQTTSLTANLTRL
jgi:hypothetical protein